MKGNLHSEVVAGDILLPLTGTLTAPERTLEAWPRVIRLQPEQAIAEFVLGGDPGECPFGIPLAPEQPEVMAQPVRLNFPHQPGLQVPRRGIAQFNTDQILGGPGPAIEQRIQSFDLPKLQQQGAKFTGGFGIVHPPQTLGQPHPTGTAVIAGKMRADPLGNVGALAHVQEHVVLAIEPVNSGATRQVVDLLGRQVRRQTGLLQQFPDCQLHALVTAFGPGVFEKRQHRRNVAHGPMPLNRAKPVPGNQRVHIVTLEPRVQPARQLHRAQHPGGKQPPQPAILRLDKAVIEARVVGDEHRPLQHRGQIIRNLRKGRCLRDHGVVDAGQLLDERRNPGLRIDQGLPLAHHLAGAPEPDTDLGNPVMAGMPPGGFDIEKGKSGVRKVGMFRIHTRRVRSGLRRRWLYRNGNRL